MKYEIRSIGLWSFVKLSFFLNLALGFLIGILYAALFGFIITMSSRLPMFEQSRSPLQDLSPVVLLVMLPIGMSLFFAVINTLFGAVGVMLYNVATRALGGLEMTLEPVAVMPQTPTYQSPVYAHAPGAPPPPPGLGGIPQSASPEPPIAPIVKPEPPASKYE